MLAVGRLESQKNYPLLIKSFQNSDLEIDIYGDGSLRKELTELSIKYNVKTNFLGKLTYNDLKKSFKNIRFLFLLLFLREIPKHNGSDVCWVYSYCFKYPKQ